MHNDNASDKDYPNLNLYTYNDNLSLKEEG